MMTNSPGRSLLLPLLAAILLSCQISGDGDRPFPSPSFGPGETVLPFSILSRGPRAQPPQVFAATTLTQLKSQVAAANPPACDGESAVACWPNDSPAPRTLLIAVYVPTGCTPGRLIGASLKPGGIVVLQVYLRKVQCGTGAGMQPAPSFLLVSVPLDKLPTGVLTVQVHYAGDPSFFGLSLDTQTTVVIGTN